MRSVLFALTLGVAFAHFGSQEALGSTWQNLQAFDMTKEPKRSDWRYFHNAPESLRQNLWTYHQKQGKSLGDWAWSWRLGWVRACEKSQQTYCRDILLQALNDDALVVRAQAATSLGRQYDGTGSKEIIEALAASSQADNNYRNGKPLFVINRILFAIHRIGGNSSQAAGNTLASRHPTSARYWKKIAQ